MGTRAFTCPELSGREVVDGVNLTSERRRNRTRRNKRSRLHRKASRGLFLATRSTREWPGTWRGAIRLGAATTWASGRTWSCGELKPAMGNQGDEKPVGKS